MLEFVTQDTKFCPYCKNELKLMVSSMLVQYEIYKRCDVCNKKFEVAQFTQKEKKDE